MQEVDINTLVDYRNNLNKIIPNIKDKNARLANADKNLAYVSVSTISLLQNNIKNNCKKHYKIKKFHHYNF